MLTLSPATLEPLSVTTYILDHRFEAKPLAFQTVARKFSAPTAVGGDYEGSDAATLILGNGVGCTSEIWIPTLKHLYARHDGIRSRVRIRSVWCVETPNTGDAAILNEEEIRNNHSEIFRQKHHNEAILRVIDTLLTDRERASMLMIGHSGGGGAVSGIIHPAGSSFSPPVFGLILIEAPWMHRKVTPVIMEMHRRVKESREAKKVLRWENAKEAMKDLSQRVPYKRWHPEVLQIMEETTFHPAPGGGVTLKTTAANEAAAFADYDAALYSTEHLAQMVRMGLPMHLIVGSRADFWPPPIAKSNAAYVESIKEYVKSMTVIKDVGHYIPQERPDELAGALSSCITSLVTRDSRTIAKL